MNERAPFVNTPDNDPSLGAYPADYLNPGEVPLDDQGNPLDPTGTLDARGDGAASFHNADVGGLFDEENLQVPDEATGEVGSIPVDVTEVGLAVYEPNSGDLDDSDLGDQNGVASSLDQQMGMKGDDADAWLKANDPTYEQPSDEAAEDSY